MQMLISRKDRSYCVSSFQCLQLRNPVPFAGWWSIAFGSSCCILAGRAVKWSTPCWSLAVCLRLGEPCSVLLPPLSLWAPVWLNQIPWGSTESLPSELNTSEHQKPKRSLQVQRTVGNFFGLGRGTQWAGEAERKRDSYIGTPQVKGRPNRGCWKPWAGLLSWRSTRGVFVSHSLFLNFNFLKNFIHWKDERTSELLFAGSFPKCLTPGTKDSIQASHVGIRDSAM